MRWIEGLVGADRAHAPDSLEREIQTQALKHQQRKHLERQAHHHDIIARGRALILMAGDGGHAAADGLEEEGDDVAGDEDGGVGEGFDAGVLGTEG